TAFIRALSNRPDVIGNGTGSSPALTEPSGWRASRTAHDVELTPPSPPRNLGSAAVLTPSTPRPKVVSVPEIDDEHLLGATAPQKEPGILRPTVLIGIGSFGRRALQEIRCRLTDRVGDVGQVPAFRFLYVDCDPDAVAKAISAPPDVALAPDEVF